jgi:acyl-CoA thioesterase FadM
MEVYLTHVFAHPKELKKMAIPPAIKAQLEQYLEASK